MQLAGIAPMKDVPGQSARVRVLASVAAAVLALSTIAACSSSKSATSPGSSGVKTSGGGGGTGTADAAAISDAYVKLFAASTPLDTSVGLLQDGEAFRSTLLAEGKTTYAKQASVTVSKVTVTSANRATVIFSVLLNKSPILPNQTGYAIRENGKWKVAGTTFCGLLIAQGNPPSACAKAAATSLPS